LFRLSSRLTTKDCKAFYLDVKPVSCRTVNSGLDLDFFHAGPLVEADTVAVTSSQRTNCSLVKDPRPLPAELLIPRGSSPFRLLAFRPVERRMVVSDFGLSSPFPTTVEKGPTGPVTR